jgi:hypothetical protein
VPKKKREKGKKKGQKIVQNDDASQRENYWTASFGLKPTLTQRKHIKNIN